jgi:hypothetical protein
MLKTNVEKHIKTILTVVVSILFISCEDKHDDINNLFFDMRLNEDSRGYYHLTVDRNTWQTLHRVSGSIRDEGFGVENFWVEWESNLYWYLGDTMGYIVRRTINSQGQYVSLDTSYIIGFTGQEVPTTNKISYSNSNGELNNMIAPVRSMIGDTLVLTATWYDGSKDFYIVLD